MVFLRRTSFTLLLVVIFLSVSSCDQTVSRQEITVGVAIPLTGTLSVWGNYMQRGMNLAVEEINASTLLTSDIVLQIEDTKSTTDGAEAAYDNLAENVSAIVGPATSSELDRIIPLADASGTVLLSPTSAASGLSAKSDYVFRASLTVNQMIPEVVRISKAELQYQTVATIVNDADTFSRSNNEKVTEELGKDSNVTISSAQTFSTPPGDDLADFTQLLTAIMNATPTPEAIFMSGLPPEQIKIIQDARRMGIDTPFITIILTFQDIQEIHDAVDGGANNIINATVWLESVTNPLSQSFSMRYRERFNQAPINTAALSHASIYLLAEALSNTPLPNGDNIRDALKTVSLNTVLGNFSFDANGDAVYSPIVARVVNGQLAIIE